MSTKLATLDDLMADPPTSTIPTLYGGGKLSVEVRPLSVAHFDLLREGIEQKTLSAAEANRLTVRASVARPALTDGAIEKMEANGPAWLDLLRKLSKLNLVGEEEQRQTAQDFRPGDGGPEGAEAAGE